MVMIPPKSPRPAAGNADQGAIEGAKQFHPQLNVDQDMAMRKAIQHGTLIFPFEEELNKLQGLEGKGLLLNDERDRLNNLEAGFSKFKQHDAIYRKALSNNDFFTAGHRAKMAAQEMRGLMR